MKKLKVYISGPMTGIKDFNYPAFQEMFDLLIKTGNTPMSPHTAPKLDSWEAYMKHDIKMLCDCDNIIMLAGWENSRGAKLEKLIADSLGIKTITKEECFEQE